MSEQQKDSLAQCTQRPDADQIMAVLRKVTTGSLYEALTCKRWKDGIDITAPTYAAERLAEEFAAIGAPAQAAVEAAQCVETCGWCSKPWPVEKCGDEDGYGPRPPCGPRPTAPTQLIAVFDRLNDWRQADHADHIVLSRSDVCQIVDWIKATLSKQGVTVERANSPALADLDPKLRSLIGRISDYFHVNAKPTDDLAQSYMRELDKIIVAGFRSPAGKEPLNFDEQCAKLALQGGEIDLLRTQLREVQAERDRAVSLVESANKRLRDAVEFGVWSTSGPTNEAEMAEVERWVEEAWLEFQANTPIDRLPFSSTVGTPK